MRPAIKSKHITVLLVDSDIIRPKMVHEAIINLL